METNEKKEFINDNIIYKKTLSISGIIYLAIAIAIFFGNTLIQGENTSLKMAMMIAGSIFVIIGLVKIMAGKKKIIYKANGCPMKRCDLYFDNHEMHRLQQSLENKQFDVLPKLKPAEGNKAGIKLNLFISEDKKYASAQVLQFIPFDYEPVSAPISFYDEDVVALTQAISNGK